MTSQYFEMSDLEDRVGKKVLIEVLDDNSDGTVDTRALERLIKDACSYVDSFLRRVYPLPLPGPEVPNEVQRLALDVAQAMLAERHPEYRKIDGAKLRERAEKELNDLAEGRRRLDVQGLPEPAANEGGTVLSNDPTRATPNPPVFSDMGDW